MSCVSRVCGDSQSSDGGSPDDDCAAAAERLLIAPSVPLANDLDGAPRLAAADGLTREYLVHHRVCPMGYTSDGTLRVAAAPDALLDDALDDLASVYRCDTLVEPAPWADVERAIERCTRDSAQTDEATELARTQAGAGEPDERTADVRDLANQPPVVRYVNLLVRDAYDAGASDVHLEATRHGLVARLRLDGMLAAAVPPLPEHAHAVVSRIKLLAELDIAERRRPQDGRIRVRLESREMDLRVSTVPTLFGESIVLRLLDHGGRPVALGELGMASAVLASTARLAARPHGMLLVTGPTGSGKTTTLYAALLRRDTAAEKVITVERRGRANILIQILWGAAGRPNGNGQSVVVERIGVGRGLDAPIFHAGAAV